MTRQKLRERQCTDHTIPNFIALVLAVSAYWGVHNFIYVWDRPRIVRGPCAIREYSYWKTVKVHQWKCMKYWDLLRLRSTIATSVVIGDWCFRSDIPRHLFMSTSWARMQAWRCVRCGSMAWSITLCSTTRRLRARSWLREACEELSRSFCCPKALVGCDGDLFALYRQDDGSVVCRLDTMTGSICIILIR